MVGKNKDHPSGGIERCKNKRYQCESNYRSTKKVRTVPKIGGASTKIGGPNLDFYYLSFFIKGKTIIQ